MWRKRKDIWRTLERVKNNEQTLEECHKAERLFVEIELLEQVRQGLVSARYAARLLDWTVDDVCEAAFGEVVL